PARRRCPVPTRAPLRAPSAPAARWTPCWWSIPATCCGRCHRCCAMATWCCSWGPAISAIWPPNWQAGRQDDEPCRQSACLRPGGRADGRQQQRTRSVAGLRCRCAGGAAAPGCRRLRRRWHSGAGRGHPRGRVDRVFNILHGTRGGGEDGVLQGLLEALGVPYTGAGVLGSALSMDKIRSKQVWQTLRLPTPDYRVVQGGGDVAAAAAELGLPLIIKPAREGSSVGVSRVHVPGDLEQAVALAARHDGQL